MIRSNSKIILIGTLPPPIGGVSIYNQRLYDYLQQDKGVEVEFIDYKRKGIFTVIAAVIRHRIVYLNCSSSVFKIFLAMVARLCGRKFIVTFHGNLERHSWGINLVDKLILRLATLTIVLNKQSFEYAGRYSKKLFLGTSFIPPLAKEELSSEIRTLLADCRRRYRIICSSNVHNVSFDKYGKEIYQVRFLLELFREMPEFCIVLSDPSGEYSNYLLKNKVDIPPNVFIIRTTHSYFELLKEVDVMLRITTTDGDSISVREALYLGKTVIASNVVDRPEGVVPVNIDREDIQARLNEVLAGKLAPAKAATENAGSQMLQLFSTL